HNPEPLLTLKSSTLFIPSTQRFGRWPREDPTSSTKGGRCPEAAKPQVTTSHYHSCRFSRLTPATSTLSLLGKKGSNLTPSQAETLRQPPALIEWGLTALGYLMEANASEHGPGDPLWVFMPVAGTALLPRAA
uniref:Uncharacterized protein n=1 Tax=Aquila chrysaetos chrysaetos TaxID=223781 RepID=A0A663F8P2_AQUCH